MKNILVCYLYTKFDNIRKINCFLKNYKKYKSGIKHDLIICFKLLDQHDLKIARKALKNIKYIEFIDPCKKNDWDFGSYKRVAKKYYDKDILYLNSHSYPICHDWLKKLCFHKRKNSIIAPTGSHESILELIKLKGKLHKIFRYIRRKRKFSKNFNSFPNPHLRTSSFLINSKHFYQYIKNKKMNDKDETLMIESGKDGMTNYFKKKKFNILVVNSDGNKFKENEWMYSETYHYQKQSKNIMSDKYTRNYLKLNLNEKKISKSKIWGN